MNDEAIEVEGKLFLYEQPEMLAREDHMGLGITPVEAPYANTREARAIPLTLTEFRSAQKHYPIIFMSLEDPIPLAITGVVDNNLFLDENNQWDQLSYVPAYLRCYPFAFAHLGEDQMSVVIDRAATAISDQPEFPFFEGEDISEHTKQMRDFAANYLTERKQTEQFCNALVEKGLLSEQHVTYRPDGSDKDEVLANYAAINLEKLNELTTEEFEELHNSGALAAIHAHMFSLENWNQLLIRQRLTS